MLTKWFSFGSHISPIDSCLNGNWSGALPTSNTVSSDFEETIIRVLRHPTPMNGGAAFKTHKETIPKLFVPLLCFLRQVDLLEFMYLH